MVPRPRMRTCVRWADHPRVCRPTKKLVDGTPSRTMTIIWTGLAEMPISEIDKLIQLLSKLPGLGPRSGRRAALTLMKRREAMLLPLIDALERVADTVKAC